MSLAARLSAFPALSTVQTPPVPPQTPLVTEVGDDLVVGVTTDLINLCRQQALGVGRKDLAPNPGVPNPDAVCPEIHGGLVLPVAIEITHGVLRDILIEILDLGDECVIGPAVEGQVRASGDGEAGAASRSSPCR